MFENERWVFRAQHLLQQADKFRVGRAQHDDFRNHQPVSLVSLVDGRSGRNRHAGPTHVALRHQSEPNMIEDINLNEDKLRITHHIQC